MPNIVAFSPLQTSGNGVAVGLTRGVGDVRVVAVDRAVAVALGRAVGVVARVGVVAAAVVEALGRGVTVAVGLRVGVGDAWPDGVTDTDVPFAGEPDAGPSPDEHELNTATNTVAKAGTTSPGNMCL